MDFEQKMWFYLFPACSTETRKGEAEARERRSIQLLQLFKWEIVKDSVAMDVVKIYIYEGGTNKIC